MEVLLLSFDGIGFLANNDTQQDLDQCHQDAELNGNQASQQSQPHPERGNKSDVFDHKPRSNLWLLQIRLCSIIDHPHPLKRYQPARHHLVEQRQEVLDFLLRVHDFDDQRQVH